MRRASRIFTVLILTLLIVGAFNGFMGNQPLIKIAFANPDTQYYNSTDSGNVGKDSHMNQLYPTRNFGGAEYIRIQSYAGSKNYRGLIYFDLSSFPSFDTIVNATLELYYYDDIASDPSGRVHEVHRITASWDEGAGNYTVNQNVTWNNRTTLAAWSTAGGDFAVTATASATIPASPGAWVKWNVTTDVWDFLNGTYSNYGWLIKDSSEDSATARKVKYWSSEYTGDSSLTPRLVIEYTTAATETWNNIETWNGTLYNSSSWNNIETWNGTLYNSSSWNNIERHNLEQHRNMEWKPL